MTEYEAIAFFDYFDQYSRGDGSTIVHIYDDETGYDVEFFDVDGVTKALVTVGGVCET